MLIQNPAAAEVDKLAVSALPVFGLSNSRRANLAQETKGEDWFDREKTKRQARQNAEQMYDEHYVNNQQADQYDPSQYGRPQHFENRGW